MGQQIKYLLNFDLGYNQEGVVIVDIQETDITSSYSVFSRFKNKLNPYHNIINISAFNGLFGVFSSMTNYHDKDNRFIYYYSNVEYNLFKTMEAEIVEGRAFSRDFPTDTTAVIMNQKFVEKAGLQNPIGKQLSVLGHNWTIVGIVKDFNIGSLENDITPALFHIRQSRCLSHAALRISSQDIPETIGLMRKTWNEIQPDKPFAFSFLDDRLSAQYEKEKKWEMIVRFSSGFAILITCMGILGLTLITINRKVKEIGIRKILGANIHQIVGLIIKEFVLLVATANIIAWPFAYYTMKRYLENYFYRISLSPQYFIFAAMLSIIIVVGTVIYLVIKAAAANPVESLRYE
jgi:putative ABC transport system permease protein